MLKALWKITALPKLTISMAETDSHTSTYTQYSRLNGIIIIMNYVIFSVIISSLYIHPLQKWALRARVYEFQIITTMHYILFMPKFQLALACFECFFAILKSARAEWKTIKICLSFFGTILEFPLAVHLVHWRTFTFQSTLRQCFEFD